VPFASGMKLPLHSHDVVIVGAGSAGSVLAARLTEDASRGVLLLDAGRYYDPQNLPRVLIDPNVLAGDDRHDWGYASEPGLTGSPVQLKRGKVLEGSSVTNAGVAIRARPTDFARWRSKGILGWSFEDVLPTFKRLENTPSGDERWHGRTGPFPIRQPAIDTLTPSCRAFVASAREIGLRVLDDFNGAEQHGVSPQPRNVLDGERWNVARAYLTDTVRKRPNLTIRGDAEIDRVLFNGRRAYGVRLADGTIEAAGDTILSAGVYGTPAILMRSGIGPAAHLVDLDIPVIEDLPVGRRLQDHPLVYTVNALNERSKQMNPALGALIWTRSACAAPDELDLQIAATHFFDPATSPTGAAIILAASVTLPDSIGTLTLNVRDPRQPPRINPNFLAESRDRVRLLEGIELARTLARTPPLRDCIHSELTVGTSPFANLRSYHHATSTAPMGDDPDAAVVDSLGRVHGVQGLRVVDASILPEIPSAPTHLTVIMIAEHIAHRIDKNL
jgi:choline dehydrogenase